jgi:hypothetical protein
VRWVLAVELLVALTGQVVFVGAYRRRRWRSTAEGRQLMVTLAYWAALVALRLTSDFLWPLPLWVFAVVWAPFGVVVWRWDYLLLRRNGPQARAEEGRSAL